MSNSENIITFALFLQGAILYVFYTKYAVGKKSVDNWFLMICRKKRTEFLMWGKIGSCVYL